MKSIADLLRETRVFDGLAEDDLAFLAECGRNERFDAGELLLAAQEPASRLYVIREGRVAIEIDAPGRQPLVIETVGAGEILGISWILPPYVWTFDARVLEPTATVSLDAECIRRKCDEDPRLGYELFTSFAGLLHGRLQAARMQLLDLYAHDGE